MKKIILTFCLGMLCVINLVPKTEACPKRFRLIKAVGRAAKTGVIKVASGLRSFKDKVGVELAND